MARPEKYRKICQVPEINIFGPRPKQNRNFISLNVDEYEVIRLIDYENLNQEETALHMDVARSTVQRIYLSARMKMAQMLVENRDLHIEGGNYQLCQGNAHGRGCRHGHGGCSPTN